LYQPAAIHTIPLSRLPPVHSTLVRYAPNDMYDEEEEEQEEDEEEEGRDEGEEDARDHVKRQGQSQG